jgi:site-specific recombinase XerD
MVSESYVEQSMKKMQEWMELRALAPVTRSVYQRCARRFIEHVGKPFGAVKSRDVQQYLLSLARQERSPRTRNVNLAAIRCALRATVHRDPAQEIPQARVERRSPEILSGSEVKRLLDTTTSLKYRAMFMVAYGAGLRVSEVASLETTDIDSERMLIHVRMGKTGPRYVMMSPRVLEALRAYWRAYRPVGPRLFPGGNAGKDTSKCISREQIYRVLVKVARTAGITKTVSPHTMRHSFATHLLESGADVRTVQMLLGHARLETTATYLHLTTSQLRQVPSPLDLIGTHKGKSLG